MNTPCDDGNSATTDDKEDGYCNCKGQAPANNPCIGERSRLENYRYDNIAGSELNDLYIHPSFPAMPTYSEVLPYLGKAIYSVTNHGRLTQAYLKVPVSGQYKFNVTGDDQTVFYLSSDDDLANKQAHQCLVSGYTNPTQWDKYQWQSTSFIYLNADQYYYVELNAKQGGGSGHFSVFWQTPFTESGVWKRLSSQYLYNYDCTLACMPQGTLCDDGNIYTNNDAYDSNCTCVGVPCSGPDCDNPLASYVPYDKCNVTDQLDNRVDNNWLSCAKSQNPNPTRPNSHWIRYDLGQIHHLLTSQVWNYNVNGETNKGFQQVAIDYSEDGTTWLQFGTYAWPLASGEDNYSGFSGPDFQGLSARYLLITSLEEDEACRGLGKVAFKAVYCPPQGTLCDDHNINTTDDKYNDMCVCEGIPLLDNLCNTEVLLLGDSLLYPTNYSAVQHVQSISQVVANQRTSFIGGDYVLLEPGFLSEEGAIFIASIDTCNGTTSNSARIAARLNKKQIVKPDDAPEQNLIIRKIPQSDEVEVAYYLKNAAEVKLEILDYRQKSQFVLTNHKYNNKGHYTKKFRTRKLAKGLYTISYFDGTQSYAEKLVVE